MPQTFYIEPDEEIISVIGRLRKSSSEENTFVFPKRALVLQSLVNLRLFQREAQKLGRRITVVTQDAGGRQLAEKAGLRTENYSEDHSRQEEPLELTAVPLAGIKSGENQVGGTYARSETIGSADYYASAPPVFSPTISSRPDSGDPVKNVRVRNASPDKLTRLNSARGESDLKGISPAEPPLRSEALRFPSAPPVKSPSQGIPEERSGRLKNFYASAADSASSGMPPLPKAWPAAPTLSVAPRKARYIFALLGGVTLISVVAAVLFFFLPKAVVHVTPYLTEQTLDMSFDGKTGVSEGDPSGTIPVRIVERDEVKTVSVTATGSVGSSSQKARGTIVISNAYGRDPQTLVATTRFETADGKVFRLLEGVTVPGMTGTGGATQPGATEASVVADQPGADFNIGPTAFAIPGFKGSPKFAKFTAQSTKAMTGGGSGGADMTVVARSDLDRAGKDAGDAARDDFLASLKPTLGADEKVLDGEVEVAPNGAPSAPQVGAPATTFDYAASFKLRAMVISERGIREKLQASGEKGNGSLRFKATDLTIDYGESVPNFSDGTIRIKAHGVLALTSDIDSNALRQALLGKDENGIQQILNAFPEVKKVRVEFSPPLLISSIPRTASRVSIVFDPAEK